MPIQIGQKLPSFSFAEMTEDGISPVDSDALFAGRKVILFAVPGAFTPTCSNRHVPGFLAKAEALRAKGIDAICCVSVNDPFVMNAWGKHIRAGADIRLLADGNADFARAVGLELDASGLGMGTRSQRYAMIVDDGRLVWLGVDASPSEARESSAEAALAQL